MLLRTQFQRLTFPLEGELLEVRNHEIQQVSQDQANVELRIACILLPFGLKHAPSNVDGVDSDMNEVDSQFLIAYPRIQSNRASLLQIRSTDGGSPRVCNNLDEVVRRKFVFRPHTTRSLANVVLYELVCSLCSLRCTYDDRHNQ